ncbi:MAG: TetR/AcrR family transcriptional regulator [Xanthomonadales bacterium]|nr:TetR/AcrR family transcriptional regulator [Xanthomonadales bacterium]
MSSDSTKERLLRAAEALIAREGFAGASMRGVTELAQVNLAAVNYHFGSKENLINEVFRRRIDELAERRAQALDRVLAEGSPPSLDQILRAFIMPALDMSRDSTEGREFVQILARAYVEYRDPLREFLSREYGDINSRFFHALGEALPQLTPAQLALRVDFIVGALTYVMADFGMAKMPEGEDSAAYQERVAEELLAFVRAGMA